jgi:microcystin-dependent protein
MPNTTKRSLPYPAGTDLISEGDNVIQSLAEALDDAPSVGQGTLAARPAQPQPAGDRYYATDVAIEYLSDGTNWIQVSPRPSETPVGTVIENISPIDLAPHWLLCDGREVSRATYATLWDLARQNDDGTLGTTGRWGNGNGTTTFNLPDFRGRQSVAPDNMNTGAGAANRIPNSTRTLAGSSGSETHSHTFNIPNHTHSGNCPSHTHYVAVPDHLHSAGSLYAPNHGHHMDFWNGNGGNRGTGYGWSGTVAAEAYAWLNHGHSIVGDTWGSGNLGIGGQTGASDRGLGVNSGGPSATAWTTGNPSTTGGTTATTNDARPYLVVNKFIRVT